MRVVGRVVKHISMPIEFGRWIHFAGLRDELGGLSVVVRDEKGRSLRLFWRETLGYRVLDEGDCIGLSELVAQSPTSVFVLEGASFSDEFVEFGTGMVPRDRFTHWVIGTSTGLIEVLAILDPEFEVLFGG